jgi:hypothetical protein
MNGHLCLVSPWMERGTLKQYMASGDYLPSRDIYRVVSTCGLREVSVAYPFRLSLWNALRRSTIYICKKSPLAILRTWVGGD